MRRPNLAYIGDVPPDRTVAGSLLVHRLLAEYDPVRLKVVVGNILPSNPADRLSGVEYEVIKYAPLRLLRTRLHRWISSALVTTTAFLARGIARKLEVWGAEAVLTVPHFYLWRAAAEAAARLSLPLYFICHDDWPATTPGLAWIRRYHFRVFRRHYRQAAARLCVSPAMAEYYMNSCGAPGGVMYPSLGEDSPVARVRVRANYNGPPVVAYAGSLHNTGYLELLKRLGRLMVPHGGRVDLYTPASVSDVERLGLLPPGVRHVGFFPPKEMANRIAATAHVLFSPVSFLDHEKHAMRMLFPSKLADYTAIGLPILIWGPEDSSAVRWSRDNPGTAAVVTDPSGAGVMDVISQLAANPQNASSMAEAALAAGCRDFDLATARERLYHALAAAPIRVGK
jgi:glycosyltransferase involved in cell wall biosynthesis